MDVGDVLDKAADLLTPDGVWRQDIFYRDGSCFCVVGALREAAGALHATEIEQGPVGKALQRVLPVESLVDDNGGQGLFVWNDAPGRTQAEVVAALREAATLARKDSTHVR